MPNEMNQEVLRSLAKRGAVARLEEIDAERKAILAAFPDLGRKTPARRGRKPAAQAEATTPAAAAPRRRGRKMTAAQRKEVADRMRRYWAERRKAKGKE